VEDVVACAPIDRTPEAGEHEWVCGFSGGQLTLPVMDLDRLADLG
jgi:hypothetical protein